LDYKIVLHIVTAQTIIIAVLWVLILCGKFAVKIVFINCVGRRKTVAVARNAVVIQTYVPFGSQIVIVGKKMLVRRWIYIVVNRDI
jgi:hypothetical protein